MSGQSWQMPNREDGACAYVVHVDRVVTGEARSSLSQLGTAAHWVVSVSIGPLELDQTCFSIASKEVFARLRHG